MIRLIKRYESRKLYDTEESRYVSLQELAAFVRDGQQVRVVESSTGEDVTAQTLAQVILEEGRSGQRRWSPEMLHDLLRRGEKALQSTLDSALHGGAEQVQQGVDALLRGSIGKLEPVQQAGRELHRLRERLERLDAVLDELESTREGASPAAAKQASTPQAKQAETRKTETRNTETGESATRRTATRETATRKTATRKTATRETATRKAATRKTARKTQTTKAKPPSGGEE